MLIRDRLRRDGDFLFRWRSYVPLVLLPLIVAALPEEERVANLIGHRAEHAVFYVSVLISLSGLALRWLTLGFVRPGTSGRNTRGQRADSLNTSGMYSVVRNPLYLGNFVAMLGVLVCVKVWWVVAIFTLFYWLYIERVIAAEEAYLEARFGTAYRSWAEATPAFIPRFRNWRSSEQPFSPWLVLRREYNGLLAVGASFFALEFILDVFVQGEPVTEWLVEDFAWAAFGLVTLVVFVSLWLLKTRTRLLHRG
jgi:protein-S-isoprenylcysteine O-methyltransferase Ste14